MNKEQTLEAIKVMQAYVDGEEIEVSAYGKIWQPVREPSWHWDDVEYRIKPKPVEFKVWYRDSDKNIYNPKYFSDYSAKSAGYRLITVREVV